MNDSHQPEHRFGSKTFSLQDKIRLNFIGISTIVTMTSFPLIMKYLSTESIRDRSYISVLTLTICFGCGMFLFYLERNVSGKLQDIIAMLARACFGLMGLALLGLLGVLVTLIQQNL